MNQLIVAFDGIHYSVNTLEFISGLNQKDPLFVKGLFLSEVDYAQLYSYSAGGMAGAYPILLVNDQDRVTIQKNIDQFRRFCVDHHIPYNVEEALDELPFPELKKQSRFADLLVISSELFYEDMSSLPPNDFLHEALHQAECPVLLVPEEAKFPQTNILAYDGSEASVFAIREFARLFPGLCHNKTLLVFVKHEPGPEFPDERNIRELVARHFSNMTLVKVHVAARNSFDTWIGMEKDVILVSGAFGRSAVSNLFRKSFISEAISAHRIPLFVAHP